jgi:hypothetical protein
MLPTANVPMGSAHRFAVKEDAACALNRTLVQSVETTHRQPKLERRERTTPDRGPGLNAASRFHPESETALCLPGQVLGPWDPASHHSLIGYAQTALHESGHLPAMMIELVSTTSMPA